jgi:hypothetical protein
VLDKLKDNSTTLPAEILINKMLEEIAKRFVNLEFNETMAKTARPRPLQVFHVQKVITLMHLTVIIVRTKI